MVPDMYSRGGRMDNNHMHYECVMLEQMDASLLPHHQCAILAQQFPTPRLPAHKDQIAIDHFILFVFEVLKHHGREFPRCALIRHILDHHSLSCQKMHLAPMLQRCTRRTRRSTRDSTLASLPQSHPQSRAQAADDDHGGSFEPMFEAEPVPLLSEATM